MPGVSRDQVELAAEDTRLTIRGRRLEEQARGDRVHYQLIERGYGAFTRSFEFAQRIDVGAVDADLAQGVLTITVPKAPPLPSRRIEVR